ncbi:ArsB/NhaD family transporter [Candidatus Bipolaricaulota bacterium]|nr:ArsB/NhaD family transporter [Candidatus Bipolaricaulota bacterium]
MTVGVVPVAVSTAIFVLTYAGILNERIHRTLVATIGAVLMLCLGNWLGFYSLKLAVAATDANTIMLLFGMMVVVGLFQATGFFEYLAVFAAKLARGKAWLLFLYLGLTTTIVSMFLDNVTTIILMIPVTMSLADILDLPMTPFLIGEVMLSNIGGVATLIGDPPNILIGSAAHLSFSDFIIHLTPIVIIVWIFAQGFLLLLYRRVLWHSPTIIDGLAEMDPRHALTDPKTTRRMLAVLSGTILLFFLHDSLGLESGIVALIGASAGLLWIWPDARQALKKVHWDVLLFFIGLFVIVGGLEASGALQIVADAISKLTTHGIVMASLVVLWSSALMSAVVDNVPFTIAMLPILAGLQATGVPVGPLWWALALGVGFGGNATPVGATANVIAISASEKAGQPISSSTWLRKGVPTALLACLIASILDVVAIYIGLF